MITIITRRGLHAGMLQLLDCMDKKVCGQEFDVTVDKNFLMPNTNTVSHQFPFVTAHNKCRVQAS